MDLVWITRTMAVAAMIRNGLSGRFHRLPAGVAATFFVLSYYRPDWKASQEYERAESSVGVSQVNLAVRRYDVPYTPPEWDRLKIA